MILYISLIYALLFKSATENRYIGLDSDTLVMVEESNAKDFSRTEDKITKTHNVIMVDENKSVYSDGSNKLSIGTKSTAFGIILSEKGCFLIQNEEMCWGYRTGNRSVGLGKCSEQGFNSGFLLVGTLDDRAREIRMKVGTRRAYSRTQASNSSGHDFRKIDPLALETLIKPYNKDFAVPASEGGIDGAREFVKFNVF